MIIPVGIHYSRKHNFRERVALSIERPLQVEGTVEELSSIISGEISRHLCLEMIGRIEN